MDAKLRWIQVLLAAKKDLVGILNLDDDLCPSCP